MEQQACKSFPIIKVVAEQGIVVIEIKFTPQTIVSSDRSRLIIHTAEY